MLTGRVLHVLQSDCVAAHIKSSQKRGKVTERLLEKVARIKKESVIDEYLNITCEEQSDLLCCSLPDTIQYASLELNMSPFIDFVSIDMVSSPLHNLLPPLAHTILTNPTRNLFFSPVFLLEK